VSPIDPNTRAAALEAEAEALRRRLDELLDELDRRRHRAAGAVGLWRKYGVPVLLAAVVLSGGAYAVVSWRARRKQLWYQRAGAVVRAALPGLPPLLRW
jgi:hypothetical protein